MRTSCVCFLQFVTQMERYKEGPRGKAPHVFSVGHRAYYEMLSERKPQVRVKVDDRTGQTEKEALCGCSIALFLLLSVLAGVVGVVVAGGGVFVLLLVLLMFLAVFVFLLFMLIEGSVCCSFMMFLLVIIVVVFEF